MDSLTNCVKTIMKYIVLTNDPQLVEVLQKVLDKVRGDAYEVILTNSIDEVIIFVTIPE